MQKHLDLSTDEKRFHSRIIDIQLVDGQFLCHVLQGIESRQQRVDAIELPTHRERKGMDRAFHALEQIDAHELNEAFFAIHLAEDAVAPANTDAVALVIRRALVG